MQFITNGPDIPESLLQAHEEGRVVFFCGAGISYKVGLKDFKWLVDEIYSKCRTKKEPIEELAYSQERYDIVLNILEDRLLGQRAALEMRKKLAETLTLNLGPKGAAETHKALLHLSQDRKGVMRLVTTNFDRAFERVRRRLQIKCNIYAAPMLPIPKNSQWDGLVYLHGLIPGKGEYEQGLDKLVVTSGDFGLAYLTERWAARFVSELFRNFVVCFVGYSINDPVLRYMMDALAADRLRGEDTLQTYALADFMTGCEMKAQEDWASKGVLPILYDSANSHYALHETLRIWAGDYTSGIQGKERIVIENALANPAESTIQDDFIGRMLWALSDNSGLPAKLFANFNPAPRLEWLEVFSDERYRHHDLARFGVTSSHMDVDEKLRFSLLSRPCPYKRSSNMTLVSGGHASGELDDVMIHIAQWLIRHLNDPALIIWLAQRGGQLNEQLQRMIRKRLVDIAGKTSAELDEIRSNAPNSIPGPLMLPLWNVLLAGSVKSFWHNPRLYNWMNRLKCDGCLTAISRFELREFLSLRVILKKPFHWKREAVSEEEPTCIRQLVDFEFVLASEHVRSLIPELAKEAWRTVLPELRDDFQLLLRDALDLMNDFGEADEQKDPSFWDLPSIGKHWQNRGFKDWVILIEFLRDAWLVTLEKEPQHARRIALGWFDIPYLTFKRLAFFAASQKNCIEPDQWVDWLVSVKGLWLWSPGVHREVMRLLALQGASLTRQAQERLENAILEGPPSESLEDGYREYRVHSVWLRLAKLSSSGLRLGPKADARLSSIASMYPEWQFEPHEREEFLHWMSGSDDPDYEEDKPKIVIAPRNRVELVKWLKQFPQEKHDEWRDSCRTQFCRSLCALYDLAQEGVWQKDKWTVALQVWSEERFVRHSWRYASSLVSSMSDAFIEEIEKSIGWWIKAVSKSVGRDEARLLELCRRVLELPFEAAHEAKENGEQVRDPVSDAINHSVGHVTQALINRWFTSRPKDNDSLAEPFNSIFSQLCYSNVRKFRHGRVLLASNLIALFRVDRKWTEKYLLPLFEWDRNLVEACAVWRGFLWSPRIYNPLLVALKPQFLSTANHYDKLGEFSRQYAAFLTYTALGTIDGYTSEEFQTAISSLSQEGLLEVSRTLKQALQGAGDQREKYWRNKISIFLQEVWPKRHDRRTEKLAESFAQLCIEAGDEFPSALSAVANWLMPIQCSDFIVMHLCDNGLCTSFPSESLRLLDAIIKTPPVLLEELEKCLQAIVKAKPELRQDNRYKRLMVFVRKNAE
jgi:hypothetical protein